jgi:hypothetical protein
VSDCIQCREYRDVIAAQHELLEANRLERQEWQRMILATQQENAELRQAIQAACDSAKIR